MESREQLIARHLSSGTNLHEELALLAQQTPEKQEVLARRLQVIDRFLKDGARTSDVDAAATDVGVARRQFYSLIAKLRRHGPVRALTPKFRIARRPAPSRDGLAEPVEAVIYNTLRSQPDSKISRIQTLVDAACKERGIPAPSASTVRRRVHAMRRWGAGVNLGPIGERLTIDQVALNLTIETEMGNRLCILTVIIDQNSKAVLGHSLLYRDGHGWGLREAIEAFGRGAASFADHGKEVAPRLKELTWIVPPGIENLASSLGSTMLKPSRRPKLKIVDAGPRRHGDTIFRLLGDRLGVTPFCRLPELRSAVPVSSPGMTLSDASAIVSVGIEQWNSKLLGKAGAAFEASIERRRMIHIAGDLQQLFAPVFAAVDARFPYVPRYELGF